MTDVSIAPPAQRVATDLALIAGFAALISACAVLPAIPVGPAPVTLQTFGVMLAGACLGARRGFLAVLLYLALGTIGLPVFAQGAAGLAVFASPTAGYLLAFPFAAWLTGLLVQRFPRRRMVLGVVAIWFACLAGTLVFVHPMGIAGLALRVPMDLGAAVLADLVFLPGDLVKNLLVALVAASVHRAFPTLLPRSRRPRTAQSPA